MSCIITFLFGVGSRLALLFWWWEDPALFSLAFANWIIPGSVTIPTWIWPALGLVFLPMTTLAYMFLFPGGIMGYEWIVMGVALLIDLAGHSGNYYHRNRVFRRK